MTNPILEIAQLAFLMLHEVLLCAARRRDPVAIQTVVGGIVISIPNLCHPAEVTTFAGVVVMFEPELLLGPLQVTQQLATDH